MANAKRDNNKIPTALITSNADGITLLNLLADPVTHGIIMDDNTTGSDLGSNPVKRDSNGVAGFMAVSSSNSSTPVALYGDSSTSALLINSN
jgi:hypothetical protein